MGKKSKLGAVLMAISICFSGLSGVANATQTTDYGKNSSVRREISNGGVCGTKVFSKSGQTIKVNVSLKTTEGKDVYGKNIISIELKSGPEQSKLFKDFTLAKKYGVFIDSDANNATGYEGADYYIENGVLYKFEGNNWITRPVNNCQLTVIDTRKRVTNTIRIDYYSIRTIKVPMSAIPFNNTIFLRYVEYNDYWDSKFQTDLVKFNFSTTTPTATPTAAPTATPTAAPTATPTATPTAAPTATPTAAPTATPTAIPTATPTPTNEPKVTIFEHTDYEGLNLSFGIGHYNLEDLEQQEFTNDMASSIKVPAGLVVTLYEHRDFTGKTIVRTKDDLTFCDDGFNDIVSSMKIESIDSIKDTLFEYKTIKVDQMLLSQNGEYRLIMQQDGNLVIYNKQNNPIWASNTCGKGNGCRLIMQGDGNLVIYNQSGAAVWASNTCGKGRQCRLVMQNDRNLVIYDAQNKPIWASNTCWWIR